MPADALTVPDRHGIDLARGILVVVVLLESTMISFVPIPPRDWQEWWVLATLSMILLGNVYVFLRIRRALQAAFVVQCIAGAYGVYVALKISWYVSTLAGPHMTAPSLLSLLLAALLGVGQIIVSLILWRLRRAALSGLRSGA